MDISLSTRGASSKGRSDSNVDRVTANDREATGLPQARAMQQVYVRMIPAMFAGKDVKWYDMGLREAPLRLVTMT